MLQIYLKILGNSFHSRYFPPCLFSQIIKYYFNSFLSQITLFDTFESWLYFYNEGNIYWFHIPPKFCLFFFFFFFFSFNLYYLGSKIEIVVFIDFNILLLFTFNFVCKNLISIIFLWKIVQNPLLNIIMNNYVSYCNHPLPSNFQFN